MTINKVIYFIMFITGLSFAEEPGREVLRSYCEVNEAFKLKLIDEVTLDGPKSNKNVAFSGFSISLSNAIERGGFPVVLSNDLIKKLEDPAYLSFKEDEGKGFIFKITVTDGYDFGDKYFSMLRFVVISRLLGESIRSGVISKNTDLIQFEKIFNELYFKASNLVKDDIDKFYIEWIIAEKVKYNVDKWQKETEDIKMVIEANKANQRSTMIRELHESIKMFLEK